MFRKKYKQRINNYIEQEIKQGDINNLPITTENLKKVLGNSADIVIRQIFVYGNKRLPATVMFIDGLVSQDVISDFVLKPLSQSDLLKETSNEKDIIKRIMEGAVYYATAELTDQMKKAAQAIISGYALLIFDSQKKAITFETKGYEKRSITNSTEESSFKGAKLAFVEELRMNTASMRLQIKSPNLTFEEMTIGEQTNTTVSLVYMRNICKEDFITRLKKRLEEITTDKVKFLTDISTYIIEHKYTIFPQVQYTEKPDAVSASLLEGKVALIIDGIPYAIVMPVVMNDLFQTPTDYSMNFILASLFRLLRYLLFFIALTLPGFYIALTKFHMEMIPQALAYAIAASKAETPFSISVEVIIMVLVFFSLIEASTRIPLAIGSTVSIVGGLILGDAAITAKLVSPGVIIVVAGAAIASMAIPNKDLNFATWLYMLINVLFSTVLGLFGLAIAILILLYHLSTLEVLGVPYLAPYAGGRKLQLGDSFIRLPQFLLKFRPYHLEPKDKRKRT